MIDILIKNRHAAVEALNVLSTYPPTWKGYFIYICVMAVYGVPMLMYHCMKFFGNRRIEQDWHDLNTVSGDDFCYEVTEDENHLPNWIQEGF